MLGTSWAGEGAQKKLLQCFSWLMGRAWLSGIWELGGEEAGLSQHLHVHVTPP